MKSNHKALEHLVTQVMQDVQRLVKSEYTTHATDQVRDRAKTRESRPASLSNSQTSSATVSSVSPPIPPQLSRELQQGDLGGHGVESIKEMASPKVVAVSLRPPLDVHLLPSREKVTYELSRESAGVGHVRVEVENGGDRERDYGGGGWKDASDSDDLTSGNLDGSDDRVRGRGGGVEMNERVRSTSEVLRGNGEEEGGEGLRVGGGQGAGVGFNNSKTCMLVTPRGRLRGIHVYS